MGDNLFVVVKASAVVVKFLWQLVEDKISGVGTVSAIKKFGFTHIASLAVCHY